MANELPEGFVLDSPKDRSSLPEGFVLDQEEKQSSGYSRTAGLTLRNLVEGAEVPVEMVTNVVYGAVNDAFKLFGKDAPMSTYEGLTPIMTRAGVPEPETDLEKKVAVASQAVAGGAPFIKGGQIASKAASPLVSAIGRAFSSAPTSQLAGEAVGSTASEVAREAGLNPYMQMVAGIAGSMAVPSGLPGKANLKPSGVRAVERAEEALGAEGTTTLAQRIGTPTSIARQQLQARAKELIDQANKSNSNLSGVLNEFLSDLAGSGPQEAGRRGRAASQRVMKDLRQQQIEATAPRYAEAFAKQQEPVDTSGLVERVQGIVDEYKPRRDPVSGDYVTPPVFPVANDALKRIRAAQGDLRELQKVKLWIDGRFEKIGDASLERVEKRELSKIKEALVDTMANASEDYARANALFKQYQGPIDAARDSFIGILSDASNTQLTSALNRVFNGDVSEIQKLRDSIQQTRPKAWEAMFRAHIQDKLNKLSEDVVDVDRSGVIPENYAAKVYSKVFGGSSGFRKLIATAPSPDAAQRLRHMDLLFKTAREGYGSGSLAPELREAAKEAQPAFQRLIGKLGGLGLVFGPKGVAAREIIRADQLVPDVGKSRLQKKLIDSIFSSEYDDQWAAVMATTPGTARSVRAIEQLVNQLDEEQEENPNE